MEFTGLRKSAEIVSLGLVSEDGRDFYAELIDYNPEEADPWVKENVFTQLMGDKFVRSEDPQHFRIRGDRNYVAAKLREWLKQFPEVEMWSDVLAYDWFFFCDLFGDAFSIPKNVYYIPFDIATLFRFCGVDPNISREEFVGVLGFEHKHNALFDAKIIKLCFEKLILLEKAELSFIVRHSDI